MILPEYGSPGSNPEPDAGPDKKRLRIDWNGRQSAARNAAEKLPELARAFLAAGGDLEGKPYREFHRFRLLAKRFRYTLEIFRPCYGPGLEQRIESLRTLQQHLGDLNDCAATEELVMARNDLSAAEQERIV